jgi:uncharacterized integral membrane protein
MPSECEKRSLESLNKQQITMKIIANLLTSLVLAGWIAAIAIFSIQNITLVSLKFVRLETIQMPVGVVLAFSVGVGAIGGAIVPLLLQIAGRPREEYYEEEEIEAE